MLFPSHFLPLVAASGVMICKYAVQTEHWSVTGKLNTYRAFCYGKDSQSNSELTGNRRLPSSYAYFRLATYICLDLLKAQELIILQV